MSTLKERIEELQGATGWDDARTAVAAGVTRSAVSQWVGKGSKLIHTIGDLEAALNLERESGYSALWIAKGKGSKMADARRIKAEAWPLSEIDEQKVRDLKTGDLCKLEAAILIAAAQVGLDIKKD
ncbi:hypothetical protein [Castellaniella sp.]|uniref:hypothetical protein n=1 Tax=Castellaniella sp. TaxID=1955812 RepID=UPI002B000E65|nr:hypothetical protein [Castellaniella sp.]